MTGAVIEHRSNFLTNNVSHHNASSSDGKPDSPMGEAIVSVLLCMLVILFAGYLVCIHYHKFFMSSRENKGEREDEEDQVRTFTHREWRTKHSNLWELRKHVIGFYFRVRATEYGTCLRGKRCRCAFVREMLIQELEPMSCFPLSSPGCIGFDRNPSFSLPVHAKESRRG